MASTYLTRTFQSGGNVTKWTFSAWVKKVNIGGSDNTIFSRYQSSDYYTKVGFGSDQLIYYQRHAGGWGGLLESSQKFRDVNGWYHFVFVWDTGNVTADDRMKCYVNGVQITDFASRTNPATDLGSTWNTAFSQEIGRFNSTDYWKGYMTHINFCDGYAYSPTDFGEFDSNGVWKINTSPSVSYGTTGFNILKDGNTITDSSANTNNWTLGGGTLSDDTDNPSNVFSTLNALNLGSGGSLDNCGNSCNMDANAQFGSSSTLGMSSGKYYMEMKYSAQVGGADRIMLGVSGDPGKLRNSTPWSGGSGSGYVGGTDGYGYYSDGGNRYHSDSATAYGDSYTVGDIIGIALDLDNNRLFFSKNGTWQDSGDPTSSTGAISIAAASTTNTECYFFAVTDTSAVYGGTVQCNFGNGYFGTTAISSAENPDNGYGAFEYDVPAGYKALCTKSLNGE